MKKDRRESVLRELLTWNYLKNDGNGNLFYYNPKRGIWQQIKNVVARKVISEYLRSKEFKLNVGELRDIVSETTENVAFFDQGLNRKSSPYWIVDSIGRVNVLTLEREPFRHDAYNKMALDFKFDKKISAIPPGLADFLTSSLGVQASDLATSLATQLFFEIIGVATSNLRGLKKAMLLLGPPNSGKSVVLHFIANIIGDDSYVPLSFRDIGERFRGSLMEGKHLILTHEMNCAELTNIDAVKAIISGDPIIIEAKGVQPKTFIPSVKILLAANSLPLLKQVDAGGAFCERLVLLCFPKSIQNRDTRMLDKLLQERDAIMSLAIKTLPELLKRDLRFVEEPNGMALLDRYKAESSSIMAFAIEKLLPVKEQWLPNTQMYEMYSSFCRENLFRPLQERNFRKELVQMGAEFGKVRPNPHENPLHSINLDSIREVVTQWNLNAAKVFPRKSEQNGKAS